MQKTTNELLEYIETGYDFDATVDMGNGWEFYEGCRQNLVMILEDPDTKVEIIGEESELYKSGIRRYHVSLPSWWIKGTIALCFDENDL